jgi:hypothetical protein
MANWHLVKMERKLSRVSIALMFFMAVLLLCVYAQIAYQADMQSKYYPQYYIHAENLTAKPDKYFILSNPDQYVLRAINGESVYVRQIDTQIYDLEMQYDTRNVEYNGSYYAIWIAFVDSFPPVTSPYILAGFAISVLGIVVIAIFHVTKKLRPPAKHTPEMSWSGLLLLLSVSSVVVMFMYQKVKKTCEKDCLLFH